MVVAIFLLYASIQSIQLTGEVKIEAISYRLCHVFFIT